MLICEHWQDFPSDDWRWGPYFGPQEFRCRGTAKLILDYGAMDKLWAIRKAADFPFIITSAGRDPQYNDRVSSTGTTGPHTTGRAFDVKVYGERALWLVANAREFGFTGVGVKQNGPWGKRFVHLDDLEPDVCGPRPWVWSY